jgi:membrane-bound serine protease (ClpP class)
MMVSALHRTQGPGARRRLCLGFAALLGALVLGAAAGAQDESGAVYVVPITGEIDLGLAPYLDRVLGEAADADAAAVLLEIDTPGGRLDAVLQMRDALLSSGVPTIAFIDRNAFSAGALIAIACEAIYMAPGAVFGAATPVDAGSGDTASEKIISAVRSTFRTTAEARGRDPRVAEAMVDPDVAIDGLIEQGKLLTLTTSEALAWGYADGVAATRAEVLGAVGLGGAPVVETSPSFAERLVRFLTNPIVASLLFTLGLLLIIGDFLVEGVGIPALVGAAMIAVFFWGHLLAGLSGWEDIGLVVLGLLLIAVELFVIPGFGVAGVLGLAALLGGMFLALLGGDIQSPDQIERAGFTVVATLVLFVLGLIGLLVLIPGTTRFGGLVLRSHVGDTATTTARKPGGWLRLFGGDDALARDRPPVAPRSSPANRSLTGATGTALTDLRPSGAATVGGNQIDVVTEGEFVRAGDSIVVVRDEGYRRIVRRVAP